jgi:transposase
MSRYIGVDISKKSMEIAFRSKEKWTTMKLDTNLEGRKQFLSMLEPTDLVGMETGNLSFLLARQIETVKKATVVVLNSGKLHMIFQSQRKTDKQDAINIGKFIERHPIEELPVVELPSEREMAMRRLISEQAHWTKSKTQSLNALHALYWNAGIVDLKRSDLAKGSSRERWILWLPEDRQRQARRIMEHIISMERHLESINEEIIQYLKEDLPLTTLLMSMPGIGSVTAITLIAYMGDFKRFSNAGQVSHFAGFTPKVDQSGKQEHYLHITKHGNHHIRYVMVQAAWGALKTRTDTSLHQFFERLKHKGKKKAIVALARKMLEILYSMIKKGELFLNQEKDNKKLIKKIAFYGLVEKKSQLKK